MNVAALQRKVVASDIAPDQLAGNASLSKQEKVAEASRQFEAVLLRQILENTQKTVFKSKYTENSTASAIYRDQITSQLADSISKSGAFGFAKTFEKQLNRPGETVSGSAGVSPASSSNEDFETRRRDASAPRKPEHVRQIYSSPK